MNTFRCYDISNACEFAISLINACIDFKIENFVNYVVFSSKEDISRLYQAYFDENTKKRRKLKE